MKEETKYLAALQKAILQMDYHLVAKAAKEAMDAKVDPLQAITEGMSPAMALIGEKFQTGEYFLPELIVAADVMKEGLKIIHPYLPKTSSRVARRVVIATVEGDNHDIGKNIVTTLLTARGFEVIAQSGQGDVIGLGHARHEAPGIIQECRRRIVPNRI